MTKRQFISTALIGALAMASFGEAVAPLFTTKNGGVQNAFEGTSPGGSTAWTGEENVYANDVSRATVTVGSSARSTNLLMVDPGGNFATSPIDSGDTIDGVKVWLTGFESVTGTPTPYSEVWLTEGTDFIGDPKIIDETTLLDNIGSVDTNEPFGTASDTWGASLTPALVNSDTFGALIFISNTGTGSYTINLDYCEITVWYTDGETHERKHHTRSAIRAGSQKVHNLSFR